MPLNTEFIDSSDGSELSVDLIALAAALPGGNAGGGITVRPYSTSVNLTGGTSVYPLHTITAASTFSVAAGPTQAASALYSFVANGNPAHVPAFSSPAFVQLTGSAGWVNVSGTLNIVSITYLNSTAYYSVSQAVADVVAPPVIDPGVETFIAMPRRTTDITLAGTTYSGDTTSGIFTSHAQSDIKMVGDGYVRVEPGVVGAGRPIWGLSSTANTINSYTNWLYAVARYEDRGSFACFYNGVSQASYVVPVTAEMRMIRTAGSVAIQHKIPAASTWTTLHTYTAPQNFTGNLWFNASLGVPNVGVNSTLNNPRMFGAS
jgi:hypothetical protein